MNHARAKHRFARILKSLVLAGFALGGVGSRGATNVFFTQFERSEGYNPRYELAGQNGWVTDSSSFGGNGLITNFLGSQAAYVGLFPLQPMDDYFSVWQPLNFRPVQSGLPIVTFSATITVVDSTTRRRDDFYWTVYNRAGWPLFTIDFYNDYLQIFYSLGTNQLLYTGVSFTNDRAYELKMQMDFAQNRWSATLDGMDLATDQPLAGSGVDLDLGDIDAIWLPIDPAHPGDNFMVFDNYRVSASAPEPVQLTTLGRNDGGQFLLRLNGPSGQSFSIDASTNLLDWTPLQTNTLTDGAFDFIDSAAPSFQSRFYRARQIR